MKISTVRVVVGLSTIATHVIAFLGIVVIRQEFFPPDLRLDLAMVLLPITAVYVTAVVRSAIRDKNELPDEQIVNLNYVLIVGIITMSFSVALLLFVFWFPRIGGPTIEDLRRWMIVVEIAFGGAFGLIAEDLFGKIERVPVSTADEEENRP
jgi:hypothetical protein